MSKVRSTLKREQKNNVRMDDQKALSTNIDGMILQSKSKSHEQSALQIGYMGHMQSSIVLLLYYFSGSDGDDGGYNNNIKNKKEVSIQGVKYINDRFILYMPYGMYHT